MPAPMNVLLANPSVAVDGWDAVEWTRLNEESGGNPDFHPLTVKAAHVVGIIHGQSECVTSLLKHLSPDVSLLPAYGIFASSVELLGRCLNGNDTLQHADADLKTGFNWLAARVIDTSDARLVIQTGASLYTVGELAQLRHYAAHGQASARSSRAFDIEILKPMPALLAGALETYWADLQTREETCNNLAKANVIPLRNWPVFRSWSLFGPRSGSYSSIGELFTEFDWQV